VTHAFSACLRTILKEYLVLVAQLEFQFASRKLTLLRAWYYLQSSFHSLTKLDALCQRVNRTAGGTFLNVLFQAMNHAGDETTKALYTHLLVHASVPYFDMLNLWLTQGIINDTYDEFQVKQHAERNKENVRKDFNDTYWDERYTVRTEKVPTFLAQLSDRILTTGKYFNVIRECSRSIPKSTSSPRPLVHSSSHERDYIDWVDSSYSFASWLLLDLLLHENDLLGRLRSVKRYFLGDEGDFFVPCMDTASAELAGSTKDILVSQLRSHRSALRRLQWTHD
jgi:gamma-tubulin complex component 2